MTVAAEPYEGSQRQRARRRRARMVAAIMTLTLVVPIVIGTIAAVFG